MQALAERRLQFLRDKLLADLADGEKLFVLKVAQTPLTEDDVDELDRAMGLYGDPVLLCACPADQAHPEGLVRIARPRVMVGYIDFSIDDRPHRRRAWVGLCQTACEMRSNRREITAAAATRPPPVAR
jgi:hypothetical protein